MNSEYLTRQSDLIPAEVLSKRITIVGAGAIGSWTALTLAKMGFNDIQVYDDDKIDPENMNCQFYPIKSIGMNKTDALAELIFEFTGVKIKAINKRVDDSTSLRGDYVISAVDSMTARKIIFEQCRGSYLVDGRMAAEYITMYSVNMNDMKAVENFKKTLYADSEAVQERCTAKSTMYTVGLISGLIGKTIKDLATGNAPITSLEWSVANNSAVWYSNDKKLTM